jgi:hypothetical protein
VGGEALAAANMGENASHGGVIPPEYFTYLLDRQQK